MKLNWSGCAGAIVWGPACTGRMLFLPLEAHRLPPPDWQPKGVGPSLNARSSGCPSIMSPTVVRTGARMSRSPSELSRVSVNTPDEPPSIVHVPGVSDGRRLEPCSFTFGLLGKFVRSSGSLPNVRYVGSKVGMPVDWPKPFKSITDKPG